MMHHTLLLSALAVLFVPYAWAEPYKCAFQLGTSNIKYDISALGQKKIIRTRDMPPSKMTDELVLNLCEDIPKDDSLPADEQCPPGTKACLTTKNARTDMNDRIISVVPVATTAETKELQAIAKRGEASVLTVTLHGPAYPPSGSGSTAQTLDVSLICSKDAGEPQITKYDGSTLTVTWSTPHGCALEEKGGDPPPPGKKPDATARTGSGVGLFFLLLFLALGAYFAIGSYYNYTHYGASGWDLLPHRDFWFDVPFMLRDLTSHLCGAIRPKGSHRGGYVAV